MIGSDKQYDYITQRIHDLSNATHDGLKLFLPIFSAILGGTIWLHQQTTSKAPPTYEYLSNALVILLGIVCVAITFTNLRSWWGFRKILAEITAKSQHPAPMPTFWRSAVIEIVMCISIFIVCFLFCAFNPFSLR